MDATDHPVSAELLRLAQAYGVSTEFWDWQGQHVVVSAATISAVLAALDIDTQDDEAVAAALADVENRPWRQMLATVTVVRDGVAGSVPVHVPAGSGVTVEIELEQPAAATRGTVAGLASELAPAAGRPTTREVDGTIMEQRVFTLPTDLPLGWHRLVATVTPTTGEGATAGGGEMPEESQVRAGAVEIPAALVVTPQRVPLPDGLAHRRQWGFMTQLYQVRSENSWGHGDLADLAEIVTWSGRSHEAGFVLVNPLHAPEPVAPVEASPYLPATRRFVSPLYIRVEDIRETAYLSAADRAVIEWHAEELRELNRADVQIDRDLVWEAKAAALERVFAVPRSPARQAAFDAYRDREGTGLLDWATWCALREHYGIPPSRWPAHAGRADNPAVADLREELAHRVMFHGWLQWILDEQLAAAQRAAVEAGMALGIVHDLAVGVHPDGADTWALQDALAGGVTVGAPPDAFNQQGQDWSQPPWRPDALADLGYAPYRDMLRSVLRHSGGIRVDHVMGLFRLWWIPDGAAPDQGTYVRYDHEALIGILALEATRAGAVVIGEDLGNVEPWVREYLGERGMFGTSILWFEKDEGGHPLKPQAWRELCLATVTTHDLPPTAGYLAGEHVEVRDRLRLLTRPVEEERAIDEADRRAFLAMLDDLGLLPAGPTERQTVEALHRMLTWTPSRLLGVALPDAVGDRRAINQPGTSNQYPNWRLPMADGVGQPVLIEDLVTSLRAGSLAQVMAEGI